MSMEKVSTNKLIKQLDTQDSMEVVHQNQSNTIPVNNIQDPHVVHQNRFNTIPVNKKQNLPSKIINKLKPDLRRQLLDLRRQSPGFHNRPKHLDSQDSQYSQNLDDFFDSSQGESDYDSYYNGGKRTKKRNIVGKKKNKKTKKRDIIRKQKNKNTRRKNNKRRNTKRRNK
jgi:hypothetical protein